VHGCVKALDAVLAAIAPAADDTIIMLGDYVDRGPSSRAVIERVIELGKGCRLVPLLGNHELMLMEAIDQPANTALWIRCGGASTIASYGDSLCNFPRSHLDFLDSCQRFHETDSHLFFHANYLSDRSAEEQPEAITFWYHLTAHLPQPHYSGKTAIVGHTPQADGNVLDLNHLLCIDTYCFGGGWLTAIDVHTRQQWQADRLGRLRTPSRG
jgi:serine/threonine protein phosphatase 1